MFSNQAQNNERSDSKPLKAAMILAIALIVCLGVYATNQGTSNTNPAETQERVLNPAPDFFHFDNLEWCGCEYWNAPIGSELHGCCCKKYCRDRFTGTPNIIGCLRECDTGITLSPPSSSPTKAPTSPPTKSCTRDSDCAVTEGCCSGQCQPLGSVAGGGACTCDADCANHVRDTCGTGYCCRSNVCRDVCISEDSIVAVRRNGTEIRVRVGDVAKGDEIEVVDEDTNRLRFEKILLFHHFDEHRVARVNVIRFEKVTGETGELEITDGHLIFVSETGGTRRLADAAIVSRNDVIWVKHDDGVVPARVVSVMRREKRVVNVVTRSANYIANGVMISSHTGSHEADHLLKKKVYAWYFDLLPRVVAIWGESDGIDYGDYELVRVFIREFILHPMAQWNVVRNFFGHSS